MSFNPVAAAGVARHRDLGRLSRIWLHIATRRVQTSPRWGGGQGGGNDHSKTCHSLGQRPLYFFIRPPNIAHQMEPTGVFGGPHQ